MIGIDYYEITLLALIGVSSSQTPEFMAVAIWPEKHAKRSLCMISMLIFSCNDDARDSSETPSLRLANDCDRNWARRDILPQSLHVDVRTWFVSLAILSRSMTQMITGFASRGSIATDIAHREDSASFSGQIATLILMPPMNERKTYWQETYCSRPCSRHRTVA